ncbi:hypothetical protein SAMN05444171_1100 [Bradyrhizobium lablabi]|uniref:Uncharacterized protein n=2 Tax=Bradyrhizobium TaxID=374 RepID=A0ABY0Q7R7_9BRAD|nr:hypothetical protein SAMN05444163_6060 [Bradyrhizobium ottawaense]SEC30476.1 hypothetical protein SAMN05444171_1100 [Bradyrhizobium lablabi]
MFWLMAFVITSVVLATVMWRFERHLEKLSGPWILE